MDIQPFGYQYPKDPGTGKCGCCCTSYHPDGASSNITNIGVREKKCRACCEDYNNANANANTQTAYNKAL